MADNGQRIRPGSIAWQCVSYLRGMKPGAEISSCMLAAAIGFKGCRISLALISARRNGVLKTRREGKSLFWSLGPTPTDWVPVRQPRPKAPAIPLHAPVRRPTRVSSVFDLGQLGSP